MHVTFYCILVIFMKGIRDITNSQRVCKMTSDDYVKFTVKRSVVSDAGTYCILARNAYGCDRAFVTVEVTISTNSIYYALTPIFGKKRMLSMKCTY